MGAILKRELSSYFNSAIAYVVLAAYFFFSGVFFYNYCIVYNSASLSYVYGNMLLIILFIIPIMTMKSFADEKYQRTDQALFTAPVSLTRVVLGKFLGAFVLYAICSAIFLLYAVVISFFATPEWSVILCTFIGAGKLKNKIAQTSLSGFFLMKSFQDLQVCPAEVSGLQLCR